MSAGDGRTTEPRIRIIRRGGGGARCCGSRARGQPRNFSPHTPPFTTPSMFNAISSRLKRIACFALTRWPRGGPQSRRPDDSEGANPVRSRRGNVTKPPNASPARAGNSDVPIAMKGRCFPAPREHATSGRGGLLRVDRRTCIHLRQPPPQRLDRRRIARQFYNRHDKGVDAGWVEVASAVAEHDADRVLEEHRCLVRAYARQRVKQVCDCDNSRGKRDRLAGEAFRIAAAIPTLMMAFGDRRRQLDQLDMAARENVRTDGGVGVYDLALLRVEPALLEQNTVGNRDFADVVERRGDEDRPLLGGREPEPLGDQAAEVRDTIGVIVGVVVAEFEKLWTGGTPFPLRAAARRGSPPRFPSPANRRGLRAFLVRGRVRRCCAAEIDNSRRLCPLLRKSVAPASRA